MTPAVVAVAEHGDTATLLADAVDRAGLWTLLEGRAGPVVVLVDAIRRDPTIPIGVDPATVEHLVDLLAEHGHDDVTVLAPHLGEHRWAENRDPVAAADLSGYRFVTDGGHPYDVVGVADDTVAAELPEGTCLDGATLPRAWIDAAARLCVVGNRTDEEMSFALCAQALLGLIPDDDHTYQTRSRRTAADVAGDLLRHVAPHFAVIDAGVSNHGRFGGTRNRPIGTETVIAGDHVLLVDLVGAVKMGVDPYLSPINGQALRELGIPPAHRIDGSLDPYEGWVNPHPLVADAVRRASVSPGVAEHRLPLTARVDADLFPLSTGWTTRANRLAGTWVDAADRSPAAQVAAAWFVSGVAAFVDAADAWRILLAKDRLHWREVPLGLDLDRYDAADFERVADYIEPLERLVRAAPADDRGLKWRPHDGSVLFEMARELPYRFDDFVARVDVSRSIGVMYDYIGGTTVAVAHDDEGRVVHQAERNLYLPQPNWMVLYGGRYIDVAKLELVRYGDGEHKVMWRTIRSPNGSADYDDGSVTFTATGRGTLVSVVARQRFNLPPPWQQLDVNLHPEITHPLVRGAYGDFFDRTLDNFAARYEGEPFRVGKPWPAVREGVPAADRLRVARVRLVEALRRNPVGRGLAPLVGADPRSGGAVDDDGFVHFEGRRSGFDGNGDVGADFGDDGFGDGDGGTDPFGARAGRERLQAAFAQSAPVMGSMLRLWFDLADAVLRDVGAAPLEDG